jgi:hypothetical protein
MPFFRCDKCFCVEDTALSKYWLARLQESPTLCSACDPKIAKWHGQFPQESADGWRSDKRGFLWHPRHVEDWLRQPILDRRRTTGSPKDAHDSSPAV